MLNESGILQGEAAAAVERLAGCLNDLDGTGLRISYEDSISGKTTCVPVLIRLADGRIVVTMDVRSAIAHNLQRLVHQLQARCSQLGMEVRHVASDPPRCTPLDDPSVRLLVDVCRTFVGKEHRPYVTGGGTYSRLFPCSVPFGVGFQRTRHPYGGPHAADEAVCIDHLMIGLRAYVIALLRLDEIHKGETE